MHVDWTPYDVLYYYSFGAPRALEALMCEKALKQLKPGSRFIVLGDQFQTGDLTVNHYSDFRPLIDSGAFHLQRDPEHGLWIFTRIHTPSDSFVGPVMAGITAFLAAWFWRHNIQMQMAIMGLAAVVVQSPRIRANWSVFWNVMRAPNALGVLFGDNISAFWKQFFQDIPRSRRRAKILDLGTGNVPILKIAQRVSSDFELYGLDLSPIFPARMGAPEVQTFVGDMAHLPVEDGAMTAVTSNHAIEYADIDRGLSEVYRVLSPQGQAAFVLHNSDSSLISRARKSLILVEEFLSADFFDGISALLNEPTEVDLRKRVDDAVAIVKKDVFQITHSLMMGLQSVFADVQEGHLNQAKAEWFIVNTIFQFEMDHWYDLAHHVVLFSTQEDVEDAFRRHGFILEAPAAKMYEKVGDQEVLIGWKVRARKGEKAFSQAA